MPVATLSSLPGQQQMGNYTDTSNYGQRSSYGTGTDNYSAQTGYSYDSSGYGTGGYGDTQPGGVLMSSDSI